MGENVATASSSGGAGMRTMVLLGILAVLSGAVAYDYLYAQPKAKKVYEEIFAYCDDSMAKPGGSDNKPKLFSPSDIHKMLGEKFNGGKEYLPTRITVVKPSYMVETYAIIGGAVFKTHDVHVVYTANDPETAKDGKSEAKFSTVELGKFPGADVLPQGKEGVAGTPFPNSPTVAGSSPGGGNGGGGNGSRRPGGESGVSSDANKADEQKDGEKKEEVKKDEAKKEEEPKKEEEKPVEEKKPEGEQKEEVEKKEEAKPEAPPAETPPAETPPTEAKPEAEKKPEPEPPKKEEPAADPPAKPEEKPEPKPEPPAGEPK